MPLQPSHPTAARVRIAAAAGLAAAAALTTLALTGCGSSPLIEGTLTRQVAQVSCISRCRTAKEGCEKDAHWQHAQCQSGYRGSWTDYRWCQASDQAECGYPWYSCSENLYGYCTNRYRECREDCRRTDLAATYP